MQPTDTLETPKPKRVKLSDEERALRRKESNRRAQAKFRAANPEYNRDRAKAIKEGTWKPHLKAAAMSVSTDAAPCSTEPPSAS